jgi:NADH:ubiquinone oxidoreductase subunit F (NADH-binding)
VRRRAVLEVPFGTAVYEVLDAAGLAEPPQALLVGGYAGTWLPWPHAARFPLSRRGLAAAGAGLGVGLLAVLPAGRCGLAETAHLVDWLAGETAGQCGPCVNGLPAIAGAFRALAEGRADGGTMDRLVRWTGMVGRRGLCHHPGGVAMLVRSALRAFDRETAAHLAGRCLSTPVRMPPLLPLPEHDAEAVR